MGPHAEILKNLQGFSHGRATRSAFAPKFGGLCGAGAMLLYGHVSPTLLPPLCPNTGVIA